MSNYTEIDFTKIDIHHAKISIYNAKGKLITTIVKENENKRVILQLKEQASGLYIVKIDFEGGVIYEKIVKAKG